MCPSTKFIDDPESYHSVAKQLAAEIPNSFMPNQYFNATNALAHYTLLGPELWKQSNGKITHFFTAAGTGGTISGVGKFLKEKNNSIQVIGFDTATSYRATKGNPQPYKLEGIGIDFDSPVMDYSVIDTMIPIADTDALSMLKTLAKRHGIMAGLSSAAVAYGTQEYARTLPKDAVAIMIFGDSGRAYLSKNLY
jgi:cystathionine beta-synthase